VRTDSGVTLADSRFDSRWPAWEVDAVECAINRTTDQR